MRERKVGIRGGGFDDIEKVGAGGGDGVVVKQGSGIVKD